MNDPTDLRELLLAYKLGELSSHEREALEERMIVDQQFSDLLEEAEYYLVQDFREDRLTTLQRSRIERARIAGPGTNADALVPLQPASSSHPQPQKDLGWARLFAALAGVSLLIAGVDFVYHITVSRHAFTASSGPVDRAPVPHPKPPQLAPEQSSNPGRSAPKNSLSSASATAASALLLLPEVTRDATIQSLHLNRGTELIRIQWVLSGEQADTNLTLNILEDGHSLATAKLHARIRNIDGSRVAEFRIPTSVFRKGALSASYLFSIVESNNRVVAEYPINIIRK